MKKTILISIIIILILIFILGTILDSKYNSHGFAGWVITGWVQCKKFKVSTPEELVEALKNKENVEIEILNDLELGWKQIAGALENNDIFSRAKDAKISNDLKESGVSKFSLDGYKNIRIYSKNKSKILHTCLKIKNSNNVKIEGLVFDELWEWDEYSKGTYKENDWDFININSSNQIWIDNCEFGQCYDGIIDADNSESITISNCNIEPNKYNYEFYQKQFDYLEENKEQNEIYNMLRSEAGLTKEEIMNIYNCQCKVFNFGTKEFQEDNSKQNITIHNSKFKNVKSRIPRVRGGNVHVYNIYVDNSELKDYYDYIDEKVISELKNQYADMIYDINRGVLSTEGATVIIENSIFENVDKPILESTEENSGDGKYKGNVIVKNCLFNKKIENKDSDENEFKIPYYYKLKKIS